MDFQLRAAWIRGRIPLFGVTKRAAETTASTLGREGLRILSVSIYVHPWLNVSVFCQYTARPPVRSQVNAVVNVVSGDTMTLARAATSLSSQQRFIGILSVM